MRLHHPWLQLLSRYRAVLCSAWRERHVLDGPRRNADERSFLPAALSLQESPPHPRPRAFAWLLMLLVLLALLWTCVGEVDIVAVAPGHIVVSDRSKVIQPLETSIVRHVLVQDGDHVQAGQLLVQLDPTLAEADRSNVHEQFLAALSDAWRSQALLRALDQPHPPQRAPASGEPPSALPAAQVLAQLEAEWQDLATHRARLQAEVSRKQTELLTARAQQAKLQALLPLSRQREADFETLVAQGFVSNHATQDRARERLELERDLSTQLARVAEAQTGVAESTQALRAYLAETRRTLQDRHEASATKCAQLQAESAKAALRERLTQLRSPVAGVVQQLAVHSAGGVVTSAQTLMVVVPDTDAVTAQVQVANLDIGFVHTGQSAEIKLETFPYTVYGTVPAQVTVLGNDAVTDEKTGNSTYPATLTLGRRQLGVDGRQHPISPGMNVTAEIKTGQRRIIDFLLSPVLKAAQESLRER